MVKNVMSRGAAAAYDFLISEAPTGLFIRMCATRIRCAISTTVKEKHVIARLCPPGLVGEGGGGAPDGVADPASGNGLTTIRPFFTAVVKPMARGYAAMASKKSGLRALLARAA